MGDVHADAAFRGPSGREERLRLLVDTGSSYTWIPFPMARRLGILPKFSFAFDLGGESRVRRRVGEAVVEILGRSATRLVVFGRASGEPVLGRDTLQGLMLHIDMERDCLVPGRPGRAPGRRAVEFLTPRRARPATRA